MWQDTGTVSWEISGQSQCKRINTMVNLIRGLLSMRVSEKVLMMSKVM